MICTEISVYKVYMIVLLVFWLWTDSKEGGVGGGVEMSPFGILKIKANMLDPLLLHIENTWIHPCVSVL